MATFMERTSKFMSKGPTRRAFAEWGWSGAGKSFVEGAAGSVGFFPKGGKYRFMPGVNMQSIKGLGIGAAVGTMVGMATDNTLLGIGAGVGAGLATKAPIGGTLGAGMKLMGPGFMAYSMYQGYQQEGVWGAAKGLGLGLAEWGLVNVGFKALSVGFEGALGGTSAALPLGAAAAVGYGAYKGAQYFAERGRGAQRTEFVGDMSAFTTRAAYTMRQRALQEINRSHTNSRTILGNEASYMHL